MMETHRLLGGRYRLGEVLGRSLMSEVRRGEDTRLRRPVAIKLLRGDGSQRSIARFEQEAQILARLQHPNIVMVFDAGVDGGDQFIVMELVEGTTLRDLLDTEGSLEPKRAAEIAGAVAGALAFAHDHGVVHRDVKPANVLLPSGGGVKLADMGIAQLLSPDALTMTLTALGTAWYTSPEQARGEPADARSDLYSLGCVLFEILAGRPPFEGDLAALLYAHAHTSAPRVRSINPGIPGAMDEFVASMLEKDPAERPGTGAEIQRALAAAVLDDANAQTARSERPRLEPTPLLPSMDRASSDGVTSRLPRFDRGGKRALMIWAGALAGIAAVISVALLLAYPRSGAPPAAGQRSQESNSPTNSPTTNPPSVPSAIAHYTQVVLRGEQQGSIAQPAGDDLLHRVQDIQHAYQDGHTEDVLHKVDDLKKRISDLEAQGQITSSSEAQAILRAVDELRAAMG